MGKININIGKIRYETQYEIINDIAIIQLIFHFLKKKFSSKFWSRKHSKTVVTLTEKHNTRIMVFVRYEAYNLKATIGNKYLIGGVDEHRKHGWTRES